ncbi:hypothetical protein ACQJBY_060635 [Aegilops geniculata]
MADADGTGGAGVHVSARRGSRHRAQHGAAVRGAAAAWPSRAVLHATNGDPVVPSISQLRFPELWRLVVVAEPAVRIGDGEERAGAAVAAAAIVELPLLRRRPGRHPELLRRRLAARRRRRDDAAAGAGEAEQGAGERAGARHRRAQAAGEAAAAVRVLGHHRPRPQEDKISLLGSTIDYVKQLEDKVRALEEQGPRRPSESTTVFESKCRISAADNDAAGPSGSGDAAEDSSPAVEASIRGHTALLKICCKERRGVLVMVLSELENQGLSIINTNVVPFTDSCLNITITAKIEEGFSSAAELVRNLTVALRSFS